MITIKKIKFIGFLVIAVYLLTSLLTASWDSKVSAATTETGFVYGGAQTIVYSSYNKNSKVVGKINRGEKLKSATLVSKNWYFIEYNNIKGYVMIGEVILDKKVNAYTGIGKMKTDVKAYVSADLRSKAVVTIKKNITLNITGIVGTWYRVENGNSIQYIPNTNVTVSATEAITTYNATATVLSPANVVHVPNALGKIQTTYARGTTVSIVGKSKSFYKIKYNKGYGYVLINRVEVHKTISTVKNGGKVRPLKTMQFYEQPSKYANLKGKYSTSNSFQIVKRSGNWLGLNVNGTVLWVPKESVVYNGVYKKSVLSTNKVNELKAKATIVTYIDNSRLDQVIKDYESSQPINILGDVATSLFDAVSYIMGPVKFIATEVLSKTTGLEIKMNPTNTKEEKKVLDNLKKYKKEGKGVVLTKTLEITPLGLTYSSKAVVQTID